MSEYLITTKDLSEAAVSAMSNQQEADGSNLLWIAGLVAMILILGGIFLLVYKSKHSK